MTIRFHPLPRLYEGVSITSGTGAAIWSKLTLDLLATITLEAVPFRVYALIPALLPFLNASWKPCSVWVINK
jgi:hypothetical protein